GAYTPPAGHRRSPGRGLRGGSPREGGHGALGLRSARGRRLLHPAGLRHRGPARAARFAGPALPDAPVPGLNARPTTERLHRKGSDDAGSPLEALNDEAATPCDGSGRLASLVTSIPGDARRLGPQEARTGASAGAAG